MAEPSVEKSDGHVERHPRRRHGLSGFTKGALGFLIGGAAAEVIGGGAMMHAQNVSATDALKAKTVAYEASLPQWRGGDDDLTINLPGGKTVNKLDPRAEGLFRNFMRKQVLERAGALLNEKPGNHVPDFYKADGSLTLTDNGLSASGEVWYGDHSGEPDVIISTAVTRGDIIAGKSSVAGGISADIGGSAVEETEAQLFINPDDQAISSIQAAGQHWSSQETMQIAKNALNPDRISVTDWSQTPYGVSGIGTLHVANHEAPLPFRVTLTEGGKLTFSSAEEVSVNLNASATPVPDKPGE